MKTSANMSSEERAQCQGQQQLPLHDQKENAPMVRYEQTKQRTLHGLHTRRLTQEKVENDE